MQHTLQRSAYGDDQVCLPWRSSSWWVLLFIFALVVLSEVQKERQHLQFMLTMIFLASAAVSVYMRIRLQLHSLSKDGAAAQLAMLRRVSGGVWSLACLVLFVCMFFGTLTRMQ